MKYIVITRPLEESRVFAKQLESLGFAVLSYPTIHIEKNVITPEFKKNLADIASYDWILFTSRNGVRFFMKTLSDLKIDSSIMQTKHIGAVGSETAKEAKKYGLTVQFIPSRFTTDDLAAQFPDINGKAILLPRSAIATPTLIEHLEKKGAKVVNIPIYKTIFVKEANEKLLILLKANEIQWITFTSPSTIEGFLKSIDETSLSNVLTIPVLSIGPVTTKKAQAVGFTKIYTADTHTIAGMLKKLQAITL